MDIICLQQGHNKTSVYCLPTVAGSVSTYFDLAKALGPGHLVHGIQCADRAQTGKLIRFASLQEMAASIAANLLAHHRDGPICLIGYSFAAVLAIEVAQQLVRHGKHVPLVAIVDKMPPSSSFSRLYRTGHFARNVAPWLLRLASRIVVDSRYWQSYRGAAVLKMRGRHRFEGDSWYRGLPKDHQDYVTNNLANLKKYRFKGAYRGKILLFCQSPSAEVDAHPFRLGHLKGYGWESVTGARVDVVPIPGDHVSMMQHPNVMAIAGALRVALNDCDLSDPIGTSPARPAKHIARDAEAREGALLGR